MGIVVPHTPSNGENNGLLNEDGGGITSQFTPSEDDFVFQNLLKWDWEHLDTVGFPGDWDPFSIQA